MSPPESSDPTKTTIVVIGVAGSGKSTVGQALATELQWQFADADDFHSQANVAKMTAGEPLIDDDRWPWLEAIRTWIDASPSNAVVACSALRRSYRDVLRKAHGQVRFLYLEGTLAELHSRLAARRNHFMLASMLSSQLDTLEHLASDEDGRVLSIASTPQQIVDETIKVFRLRDGMGNR